MYFLHPTLTCQARLNNFSKLFFVEQFSRKQKTCIIQILLNKRVKVSKKPCKNFRLIQASRIRCVD